jgi:hypothetical protein
MIERRARIYAPSFQLRRLRQRSELMERGASRTGSWRERKDIPRFQPSIFVPPSLLPPEPR